MHDVVVNPVTSSLEEYPMEELFKIKQNLINKNQRIYDFGVGDPTLPLWKPAIEALKESAGESQGYPSIGGTKELKEACADYLLRRFFLKKIHPGFWLPQREVKKQFFIWLYL